MGACFEGELCCWRMHRRLIQIFSYRFSISRTEFRKYTKGRFMESKGDFWKSMSLDDLWHLHRDITVALNDRMVAKKVELEEQLRKIQHRPGNNAGRSSGV
jgi:hypothetical protein